MSPKTTILFPGALLVLLVIGGICLWGLSALFRRFGIGKTLLAAVLLLPAIAVGTILLSLVSYRSQGVNVQMAHESQQRAILQQHEAIQAQHRAIQEHAEQLRYTADASIEHTHRMVERHAESLASPPSEQVQPLLEPQPNTAAQNHSASTSVHVGTNHIQRNHDWMFLATLAVVAMLVLSGMIGTSVYLAAQGGTLQWGAVGSKLLSIAWVVPILVIAAIPMYMIANKLVGWTFPDFASQTVTVGILTLEDVDHHATTGDLPDWVQAPQQNDGQTRVVVVSSNFSPAVDASDTDRAISIAQNEVYEEAAQQIRAYFGETYPVQNNWPIPDEIVRRAMGKVHLLEKDVDGGGKVYRRFAQVNLTPGIRQRLLPQWKTATTQNRLWTLCAGLGLLTLLLGTTAGYLRLDRMTDGAYRGRLKLASLSVITAVALVTGMFVS
ncbi:hypothetical protein CA54_37620 [Symmachiella macrocystis]|uniref:Uncharacterized protein n=1 Tax=Symmachiella macrocystis TaxID=2527985 RepID=A0A5C6BSZ4_9PLAN|nr:hypothetical protein [Symmachiella macrocystis]TWU14892.1 hypothetical protein CA54_37620 [Symmachiella macrocystis]